ncbi:MAG: ClpP family protease [Planctomycetota bacterium]
MTAMNQDCEDEEKQQEPRPLSERLLQSRTVLMAEQINKELAQRVISHLLLLDQEDTEEPIDLYINSPGGDVDAGFAIYDIARYIDAPVRCISNGLTASAAVVVLLAPPAERRFSLPNSRFLMHQPSTGVKGSTADIKIEANEIIKMREKINRLIAGETDQDVEKVEQDTRRNYWIDAEQAQEYGLISKIIAHKDEIE